MEGHLSDLDENGGEETDGELTQHQRHCLEHLRQAESLGMWLKEYARTHGIKVRMLYDAVVHFRRTRLMAERNDKVSATVRRIARGPEDKNIPLVAVRVEPEPVRTDRFLPVLRLQHVGKFAWPMKANEVVVTLSGEQLNWLMDGYDVWRMTPHKSLSVAHIG